MVAGLGSTWWQYLLLFLAVAASWAGVPVIGTVGLGAAAVAATRRHRRRAAHRLGAAVNGTPQGPS